MSRALYCWYSLNELEALGRRQARMHGIIDVARLTRLCELLKSDNGSVRVTFNFSQQQASWVTVDFSYEGQLDLVCQRCLDTVTEHISGHIVLAILEDDSMERIVPAGCEPVVLSGKRFQPLESIEDELIISLPLVARHSQIDKCVSLVGL
ncbi:MAG: hypothetical protein CMM56_06405 [Rhodospirillaceae bacterium]|nr:hypothetical protein [Rhodospirillaceae bacterium]